MRMFLAVLGVVLLGSVVACANGLGFFGSYWDTKDADSDWGGGAKLQLEIIPNVFVEARGTYFPEFGEKSGDEVKVDIIPVEADAILKFPIADQFKLYGGGGAGYYIFNVKNDVDDVDIEVDNELGYFAVAGVEIALSEQVSLFAEGKYTWLDTTTTAKFEGVEEKQDDSLDGFGGVAGIMLTF